MKLYCSSCGAPNSYTVDKPNFCQKCGNSVGETKAAQKDFAETDPEDGEPQSVPSIDGLEFDVVGDMTPRSVTLATLSQIASDPINPGSKPKKKKAPRVSKKKVLEDFRKEAGAIRPDNG